MRHPRTQNMSQSRSKRLVFPFQALPTYISKFKSHIAGWGWKDRACIYWPSLPTPSSHPLPINSLVLQLSVHNITSFQPISCTATVRQLKGALFFQSIAL